MNLYAASPDSLWSSPAFVRVMACSVAGHAAAIFLVVYGPIFRFHSVMLPEPVMVNLDMALPAEPAPPEPPPPEPPVVPPAPEPKPAEPEPQKQEVKEALVVPDVPPEKPKPKKPKPQPKPQDVADVMASLRKDVEKQRPPQRQGAARGTLDPEMASYIAGVKGCLRQNWVGAQRFQRRRDLLAEFEVQLGPGGKVTSAEVTRPSGEDFFDETAERAIFKCQPWPEPPGGQTIIPIRFVPEEMQ